MAKGNAQKPGDQGEVSSPSKPKNQRARNKQAKNGSSSGKEIVLKGKGEKLKCGASNGSADQVGAVDQPHRTQ
jgi:hypothetical protein